MQYDKANKVLTGTWAVTNTSTAFNFGLTGTTPFMRATKLRLSNASTTVTFYLKFRQYASVPASSNITSTDTTLVDAGATWATNEWKNSVVTCNGKTMTITSNTATTLTGSSWSGGSNPGNGNAYSIAATVASTNVVDILTINPTTASIPANVVDIDDPTLTAASATSSIPQVTAIASAAGPTNLTWTLWYY